MMRVDSASHSSDQQNEDAAMVCIWHITNLPMNYMTWAQQT